MRTFSRKINPTKEMFPTIHESRSSGVDSRASKLYIPAHCTNSGVIQPLNMSVCFERSSLSKRKEKNAITTKIIGGARTVMP